MKLMKYKIYLIHMNKNSFIFTQRCGFLFIFYDQKCRKNHNLLIEKIFGLIFLQKIHENSCEASASFTYDS